MKQVQILRDAGYAVDFANKKCIRVHKLFPFSYVNNQGETVVEWYPESELLNNNPWAVTRFLNRCGSVGCLTHREMLQQYDTYKERG